MPSRSFLMALTGAAVLACGAPEPATTPPQPCATLPDAPAWDPATDAGVRTIVQFARGLTYEPAAHPTGERRPLTQITQRGAARANQYRLANQPAAGPGMAQWGIGPQQCAHRYDVSDLGPGGAPQDQGAIVGWVNAPQPYYKPAAGTGSRPYCTGPSAGCREVIPAADSVFLWVDSLNGGTARGFIIPVTATTAADIKRVDVQYEGNSGFGARAFPEARWIFDVQDDDGWVSCAKTGCCRFVFE